MKMRFPVRPVFLVCFVFFVSTLASGQLSLFTISNYVDNDTVRLKRGIEYMSITGGYSGSQESMVNLYQTDGGQLSELAEVVLFNDSSWRVDFFPNDLNLYYQNINNLTLYFYQIVTVLNDSGQYEVRYPLRSINLKLVVSPCDYKSLSQLSMKITNIQDNQRFRFNSRKRTHIVVKGEYASNDPITEPVFLVESSIYELFSPVSTDLILKNQIVFLNDSTWLAEYVPTYSGRRNKTITLYVMSGVDCGYGFTGRTQGGGTGVNQYQLHPISSWATAFSSVRIRAIFSGYRRMGIAELVRRRTPAATSKPL